MDRALAPVRDLAAPARAAKGKGKGGFRRGMRTSYFRAATLAAELSNEMDRVRNKPVGTDEVLAAALREAEGAVAAATACPPELFAEALSASADRLKTETKFTG